MDYKSCLEYLYSRLPMFQRVGGPALKTGLGNTQAICAFLGNPEKKFRSVHVAGTNGKGSSSHALAAILQTAGFKTGLYTSPHLKSFTERIRINGQEIPENEVVAFTLRMQGLIAETSPSFFEITVGMAFDWFAREQVDYAVVETGMGGRLDSTNVLLPEACLITNISHDHNEFLGDTLAAIAGEKAGIVKTGVPVAVGERHPETDEVFVAAAQAKNALLFFTEDFYRIVPNGEFVDVLRNGQPFMEQATLSLKGRHQFKNMAGALMLAELLGRQNGRLFTKDELATGLANVQALTGLKGRWQQLGGPPNDSGPWVFCDVGHNEAGIRTVLDQIATIPYNRLFMVIGMVQGKDHRKILKMLPKNARYCFCQPDLPRALPAATLAGLAAAEGLEGTIVPEVELAFQSALADAAPGDLVFVGGSTFTVAGLNAV